MRFASSSPCITIRTTSSAPSLKATSLPVSASKNLQPQRSASIAASALTDALVASLWALESSSRRHKFSSTFPTRITGKEPGPPPLQTRPRATAVCITASSISLASSSVSQDDMLKTNMKPCAYLTWYSNIRALRCQDGEASVSCTPVTPADRFSRTLRFVEGTEEALPSLRLTGPEANRVASRILSRPV